MNKKKLLVLGSGNSTKDLVIIAKSMGFYVIVSSNYDSGVSNDIADEKLSISVTDIDSLHKYIVENKVAGVFTGPSEFHLLNVMKLCRKANLPFYTTEDIWNICSDKRSFKNLCQENDVPCVPEYVISNQIDKEDFRKINYPVIVKPVDSCSSKGITVCKSENELNNAIELALFYSEKKEIIIEPYIQNNGIVTNVRYLAVDGDIHLSLLGDTYVVDPINKTALITAVSVFPSMYTKEYMKTTNHKVVKMFKRLGIKNASFFMQSLPYNGTILFHEMGMRVSGGLIYKITEPISGINDLKMMINYSMGEKMYSKEEISQIDPFLQNKIAIDFCIPLKEGIINEINGIDSVLSNHNIVDYTQYYDIGDQIKKEYIGTLLQHFCRIKFFSSNINDALEIIDNIQNTISITSITNDDMIYMKFDVSRIKKFEEQYERNSQIAN